MYVRPVNVSRAEFLRSLVWLKYPFRRAQGWPSMAVRMLSWGLSAATVLHVLDVRYRVCV